jgi:hypothetical protein
MVLAATLSYLDKAAEQKKPFFIAMGLRKPHMPFCGFLFPRALSLRTAHTIHAFPADYPNELDSLYLPANNIAPPKVRS